MICSMPRAPSFTGTPTKRPLMPYSPSRYAAQGRIFLRSLMMASTISTTAAEGAYQALVFRSPTISAPPSRVRWTRRSIVSLGSNSVIGIPETVEYLGDGNMEFHGNERPEPRRIQHAGHADDTFLGKPTRPECSLHHRIQRIADDNND